MRFVLAAAVFVGMPSFAFAQVNCTPANLGSNVPKGQFGVLNGKIYAPNEKEFVPYGVNVSTQDLSATADKIDTLFPGINFLRVPVHASADMTYPAPETFAEAVKKLSAKGIVVLFENHTSNDQARADRGGGLGTMFTPDQIAKENDWFKAMGAYYKDNPMVWAGTNNEPSEINPATGKTDRAGLSAWQGQTYDAWRSSGNNSPLVFQNPGWADPKSFTRDANSPIYAKMSNVIADVHYYGWQTGYSKDQGKVDQALADMVSATKTINTAGGSPGILIGEYGDSTSGESIDPNGTQVIDAVGKSGLGSSAWWLSKPSSSVPGDALLDGNGGLSAYGQKVQGYIQQNASKLGALPAASTGCDQTALVVSSTNTGNPFGTSSTVTNPPAGVTGQSTITATPATENLNPPPSKLPDEPPASSFATLPSAKDAQSSLPADTLSTGNSGQKGVTGSPIQASTTVPVGNPPMDYLDQTSWWKQNPAALAAEQQLCSSGGSASLIWMNYCDTAGAAAGGTNSVNQTTGGSISGTTKTTGGNANSFTQTVGAGTTSFNQTSDDGDTE